MPASAHHELDVDEQAIVDAWRLLQFLQVGYAQHRAEQLAACADVDVHLACWLLANGCDERTALRILL